MNVYRLVGLHGISSFVVKGVALFLLVPVLLLTSVSHAQDIDGDGVVDEVDCSPGDGSIAFPHRYYLDLDGDQSGDLANSFELCSLTPFPGTVLWHGDSNDSDVQVFPIPVPRGNRIFGLDFLNSNEANDSVLPYIDELGVQAMSVNVHWVLLESEAGVFNGTDSAKINIVRDVASYAGIKLNLTLSAVSPYGIVTPVDLAAGLYGGTLRFSDQVLINRYNAALTELHQRLGSVELVSLQVGHEIDRLIRDAPVPGLWSDFEVFYAAVAAHAKSLWGGQLKVGVTSTEKGLKDPITAPFMDALNAHSDIISFTYNPRATDYTIADPANLVSDLGEIIARYPGRELSIQSMSFPSAPVTGSSETRQSQFIAALFAFWDEHDDILSYTSLYSLFDRSDEETTNELVSHLNPVAVGDEATAEGYFRSVGLRGYSAVSGAKSAYYSLRNHLFARGWDAFVQPTSRSFNIGLTSFVHDQIPDQPLDDAVLDQLYSAIATDADMVAHHFDLGVPWQDALLDDFSSTLPPYSADVLDVWNKHRSRHLQGQKVTVSINPLGIPRDRLAAYWGYGEGAVLDSTQNIVGTGIFADYHSRLLTPPFDTLSFNSPEVKTAYLSYLKRVIDYFNPDYLMTGIEVNLLADPLDSTTLNAYVELQQFVYDALKSDPDYATVVIGVTFTAEHFLQDELGVPLLIENIEQPGLQQAHFAAFQAVEPFVDIIGLSIYPVKTRFGANQIPVYMFDQMFERLGSLTDKPFAITETGFPSQVFTVGPTQVNGTAENQARYLQLLYAEAAKSGRVAFITQFSQRDITPYMDLLRLRAAAMPPLENPNLVEFYQLFEFIGLYDAAGNAKPVMEIVNQALALEYEGSPVPQTLVTALSPDGQLQIQIGINDANQLYWSAHRNGLSVIEPSIMGITIDGIALGDDAISIAQTGSVEINETFATRGAHSIGSNHYLKSEVIVQRTGVGDPELTIELRVFNDGLAFRYLIPGSGTRQVSGESTSWTFPEENNLWFHNSTTNYESGYYTGSIGLVSSDIGFPVTVEVPSAGVYVTLSEADIGDYSGMSVRGEYIDLALRAQFLEDEQWSAEGGTHSPWRFSIIATDLNTLVNSDMVAKLNPEPDISLFPLGQDTSWIRPGKALWSWWTAPYSGADYSIQQDYIDQAHAMGLEYVTIDAWWEAGFPVSGLNQFQRLAELVAYAHSAGRNVDLWVWKNYFELIDPVERQGFFDDLRNAGVVGVKIDSIYGTGSDLAIAATLRQAILRDAAERQLMVNFHGLSKPTGLSRTFPNLMTEEGFAGLEGTALAWELGFFVTAKHNTTLPFTRFVLGPGDYTPVTFDQRKIGGTTFTHQLATAGIFASPVMHYADDPNVLQQVPEVQDLLREMPTEWDETRVLPGSLIGERVVMARRHGSTWWLFVLNGKEDLGINLTVDLTFLGASTYNLVEISDLTPTSVNRQEYLGLSGSNQLDIDLLPGGGLVGRFM